MDLIRHMTSKMHDRLTNGQIIVYQARFSANDSRPSPKYIEEWQHQIVGCNLRFCNHVSKRNRFCPFVFAI